MNIHSHAQLILAELDHFQRWLQQNGTELTFELRQALRDEPLVGYAFADKADGSTETVFVCRHGIPNWLPNTAGATYASYFSPLGKIITRSPGEEYAFQVKHQTGLILAEHHFVLSEKNQFRSRLDDERRWDGQENRLAWIGGQGLVRSLRALLAGAEVEGEATRSRQIRVQLPDIAILDAAQDDLFRLPYNEKLRISGAPGTGKTTVLLKRISQKTKYEFLTDAEKAVAPAVDWQDGQNWMLFTPSDLLKSYLKEALAKELLPAGEEHVKVYPTFRQTVLRELGLLGGTKGYFRAAASGVTLLKREERGSEHVLLTRAFGEALIERYAALWRDAVRKFNDETRAPLGELADANQQVLLKGAEILAAAGSDVVALREAQTRFTNFRSLNQALNTVVAQIRSVGALQDADGTVSLPFLYRKQRQLLDLLPSITSDKVEAALFPTIPKLIGNLRREVEGLAEAVSLRRLFDQIPRTYQGFREAPENWTRYFAAETEKPIRDKQLSAPEQDTLLFHTLDFYRTLHGEFPADMDRVPSELRNLRDRMRILIAVDETTDFSALEIACMSRFATPRRGGVTICGDLLQRVTSQGIKTWEQLDELDSGFRATELNVSYRQTPRLFAIARDLYAHVTGEQPRFRSAHEPHPGDPAPLWFRPTAEVSAGSWLADRIVEICDLCNGRLPTTAILVPQTSDVPGLHSEISGLLQQHGIGVDASERGNALGDEERVRVFPVEYIKGLEFEVVFYVGLDRMADVHKDLIEKYFYVGLSRARSFLGVTCERTAKQLPQSLQCVHPHFAERITFAEPSS